MPGQKHEVSVCKRLEPRLLDRFGRSHMTLIATMNATMTIAARDLNAIVFSPTIPAWETEKTTTRTKAAR